MADTVGLMGYELSPATRQGWGRLMRDLASADSLSEENPHAFSSGEALVECLNIEPNAMAIAAAEGLLRANVGSLTADTIAAHLDSRRDEALESATLLRSQAPEIRTADGLWREINAISVAGIYLDSCRDAREDAHENANFSAAHLVFSAGSRFIKTVSTMNPHTRLSAIRACCQGGLTWHLVRDMPKKLMPAMLQIR